MYLVEVATGVFAVYARELDGRLKLLSMVSLTHEALELLGPVGHDE